MLASLCAIAQEVTKPLERGVSFFGSFPFTSPRHIMQFVFPQQSKLLPRSTRPCKCLQSPKARSAPHFHLTGPSGSGKPHLLKPHWKAACWKLSMGVLEKG